MRWKKDAERSRYLADLIRFHAWNYIVKKVRSVSLREPRKLTSLQRSSQSGYEDCVSTSLMDSEGDSGLLRDAIATVYVGEEREIFLRDDYADPSLRWRGYSENLRF